MTYGLTSNDIFFLLRALPVTLELSCAAMIIGTILALLIAFASMSKFVPVRALAWGYVQIVRGSPLLMQVFFIFFGLPILGINVSTFGAAVSALILNTAGFMAEIIRGGLQSIEQAQVEASEALGLTRYQSFRYVIFPQAVQIMIPPSIGQFTALVKNSSVASTIGFIEMTRAGRVITERTGKGLVMFFLVGLMYFIVCYHLSRITKHMERRLALIQ